MRDAIVDLVTGSVMGVVIWFGVPVLLRTFGKVANRATRGWLVGAIALILLSFFLPSPWLTDHTETFSQHFVGGGVASALIGYYLIGHFEVPRFHRGLLVLSLVSVLGVANEMFELAVDVVFRHRSGRRCLVGPARQHGRRRRHVLGGRGHAGPIAASGECGEFHDGLRLI